MGFIPPITLIQCGQTNKHRQRTIEYNYNIMEIRSEHSLLYIWPNSKKTMDILEVIIRNEFNIVVITIIKRRSQIALSWNINYIIKKFYTSLRS